MARIELKNLSLTYPVVNVGASIRRAAMSGMTGGLIQRGRDVSLVEAIRDITLTIQSGDRVGLIGHNGAGKSTLLRVLAGIYKPTRGAVNIEGRVGSLLDIGFGIDPEETGWQNLMFVSKMISRDAELRAALIDDVAEFTELGEFLDMPVRTYSAGMQMRLSFGIATATCSNVLLMDEVIGAGDASFYKKAEQRLHRVMAGADILVMATHSIDLVSTWCNKAIWLDKGSLKAAGNVDSILESYLKAAE